jgi:hypothetical protein
MGWGWGEGSWKAAGRQLAGSGIYVQYSTEREVANKSMTLLVPAEHESLTWMPYSRQSNAAPLHRPTVLASQPQHPGKTPDPGARRKATQMGNRRVVVLVIVPATFRFCLSGP